MEHPPKQGLKPFSVSRPVSDFFKSFNGTSTKTRIETTRIASHPVRTVVVLMEHPPKQGLKPDIRRT